jgi:hypothetical protein
MSFDTPSATAFSPPAIVMLVDRRGGASPHPRPRPPKVAGSSSIDKGSAPVGAATKAESLSSELSSRIRLLRIEAYSENIPFSESSLSDFAAFFRENSPRKRPAVFLTDSGNIRALWRTGEEQIGLQFLGNREIQFVIFSVRPRSKSSMDRLAGNIGQDAVMSFARAAGVEHLFSA